MTLAFERDQSRYTDIFQRLIDRLVNLFLFLSCHTHFYPSVLHITSPYSFAFTGEAEDIVPDVDDTDGLDPTAEFDDWRLRELARLTREKETALAREEERKEIERRREMPEHVRLAEDEEYARRTREQNPKEKRGFLEKYYHKGAFHQVSSGRALSVIACTLPFLLPQSY